MRVMFGCSAVVLFVIISFGLSVAGAEFVVGSLALGRGRGRGVGLLALSEPIEFLLNFFQDTLYKFIVVGFATVYTQFSADEQKSWTCCYWIPSVRLTKFQTE